MNTSEKSILHYMESLGEETTTREINESLMIANIQTTRKYVGNLKKLGFIKERVVGNYHHLSLSEKGRKWRKKINEK